MGYAKNYTPASIKLVGKEHRGQTYLFLMLAYGYTEQTIGPKGKVVTTYKPLKSSTGFSVRPEDWQDGDFNPAFTRSQKTKWTAMITDIERQRQKLFTAFTDLSDQLGTKPSPDQILEALKGKKAQAVKVRLADYIRDYADGDHAKSPLTKAKFRTVADMVEVLEDIRSRPPFSKHAVGKGPIYVHTFGQADWQDFTKMIATSACQLSRTHKNRGARDLVFVGDKKDATPFYSQNTLEKFQQNLLVILNRAGKDQRSLAIDPKNMDKVSRLDPRKECLLIPEIAKILEARFDQPGIENARRLFSLQLFTGVPVGDLDTLLDKEVRTIKTDKGGSFKAVYMLRSKTNTPICLPLFKPALDVLESDQRPKVISAQKYNDHLKELCKRLDIDRIQHTLVPKADGTVEEYELPLWELVSTHTARRSFKVMMEGELCCQRERVCDAMGHAYPDKSADRGYMVITPEKSAELLLRQASINADSLPFQLMP